ncbi:MAG: E3 binding domain-containing protein [Rubrobacteraceae bacterium]
MAKKTKKAVKQLTKAVEELREQNEALSEKLTGALEEQAEATRTMMRRLESRLEDLHEEDPEGPAEDEDPEATEAAERKADELDVELSEVEGTGSEGRILVSDVEEAADSND